MASNVSIGIVREAPHWQKSQERTGQESQRGEDSRTGEDRTKTGEETIKEERRGEKTRG